jgi:hypothetical protein
MELLPGRVGPFKPLSLWSPHSLHTILEQRHTPPPACPQLPTAHILSTSPVCMMSHVPLPPARVS